MGTNIKYIKSFERFLSFRVTYILLILTISLFTFSVNVFATPPSSPIQIKNVSLEKNTFNTNENIKVNLRLSCRCEDKIENVGIYTFFDKDPYRNINFYQENPIKLISLNSGEDNKVELILPQQEEGKHSLQISVIKLDGNSGYAGDTEQLSIEVIGQRNILINLFINIRNFFYKLFQM